MHIDKLILKNYRNILSLDISLNKGVNVFVGENAQGKTNILESIYLCCCGRSNRTHIDKDLINFNFSDSYINLFINKNNFTDKINIHLKKDKKKGIAINGIPIKKLDQLFGIFNVVMFSPQDLNLIKSGPLERRKFLDMELCQINKFYCHNLTQYYKVLKHRNSLLKNKSFYNNLDSIFVWDEQLLHFGKKIIQIRQEFIDSINPISNKIHSKITGKKENLTIKYKPSVSISDFKNKLTSSLQKDIQYMSTSFGPHKDDLLFFINDINVKDFGSQGQHRTVCLSTKLAEIELIYNQKGFYPILLLDDVFSELDRSRQQYIISNFKNIQTIITCTGVEDFINNINLPIKIFNVHNGCVY